jgi:hypothetical protein
MAEHLNLAATPGIATPQDFGAPVFEPAETSQNSQDSKYFSAPDKSAPQFGAQHSEREVTDDLPLDEATSTFDVRDLLVRRSSTKTYTVHPVSRIEDVFTSAERDLLRWLWERGKPVPLNQKLRLAVGPNGEGARRLATQAGLIYNTFKNLTRSLCTKLALDIVKPERNLPAVYAVYHYSAILERQRRAGYTGVVHKNGGGRELVTAGGQPASKRPDFTLNQLQQIITSAPNFSALTFSTAATKISAVSYNSGAPNSAGLLRNKKYTSGKKNTSSPSTFSNVGALTIITNALFERTGRTDTVAARAIVNGCLEANSTIEPAEIARLIYTVQIPANIANPVGLLIRTLPSRCAPESILHYRESWRREDERESRHREEEYNQTVETAQKILHSVSRGEEWDADTINWAKEILAKIDRPKPAGVVPDDQQ